jgi:hypothetical protein
MALPDFLIIGAMKCGTSTLAAQIGAQPGLFMTTPKEPNYFSDDAVFARGRDWYESLFDPAAPGDLKGEASTHYTKLPTHPQALARMAALLAAPKLVYLIRNPVDRAVSHYIHEWSMGVMTEEIDRAFDLHPELVAYSCYARQIAPYRDHYGPDSLLLLTLEEMELQPQAVLDRVCAFLGHPDRPVWQDGQDRVNASAERIRRLPLHGLLVDNPVATALRRLLVPQALRDRIRRSRQIRDRPDLPPARRAALEAIFTEDHAALRRMFPDHPALAASYPFVQP